MGDDGLGPLFGSLPPDVLKQVILPELDLLERGLFALASGACWRAMKDSGLSCRLEKGVVCCLAASGGHLECLRYVREQHGCPWGAATCVRAAGQGHLECLRYAHEHGCPWDADTCARAAGQGQLECLRYAHEHGCPWDADTCARAARQGHWSVPTRSTNGPVRARAAPNGHLLANAHEHGCPWDAACAHAAERDTWSVSGTRTSTAAPGADTCTQAAFHGQLECLQTRLPLGC